MNMDDSGGRRRSSPNHQEEDSEGKPGQRWIRRAFASSEGKKTSTVRKDSPRHWTDEGACRTG